MFSQVFIYGNVFGNLPVFRFSEMSKHYSGIKIYTRVLPLGIRVDFKMIFS